MTTRRHDNDGRCAGFTLVELLTVIAALGLLAALLLPALAAAQERGRQSSCLTSERQLAIGARFYMDDHGGGLFHHHEGWVLDDATLAALPNPNVILFSERNSEALNAADNAGYGNVGQDDYDAWVGESALVQWGSGHYANQGWIRYNRHQGAANYVYADGHVERQHWRRARLDHFPDHRVRNPLAGPPN